MEAAKPLPFNVKMVRWTETTRDGRLCHYEDPEPRYYVLWVGATIPEIFAIGATAGNLADLHEVDPTFQHPTGTLVIAKCQAIPHITNSSDGSLMQTSMPALLVRSEPMHGPDDRATISPVVYQWPTGVSIDKHVNLVFVEYKGIPWIMYVTDVGIQRMISGVIPVLPAWDMSDLNGPGAPPTATGDQKLLCKQYVRCPLDEVIRVTMSPDLFAHCSPNCTVHDLFPPPPETL